MPGIHQGNCALAGELHAKSKIIDTIRARGAEFGDATLRFGLFLFDCSNADAIPGAAAAD